MPNGYEGFQSLGEALGGIVSGNIGTPGVYDDTLKKAYSVNEQLQQAGKARAQKLIAEAQLSSRQGGLKASLIAGGMDPAQAAIVEQVMQANQTFGMSQAGGYARPGYLEATTGARDAILGTTPTVPVLGEAVGEDAMYAQSLGLPPPSMPATPAATPDVPRYNMLNALATGKSYQPVRELGGAFVGDGVALGDLDAVPTPESLSRLEENEAQGKAALVRANRPAASHSSGASKPQSAASAEGEVLQQARNAIAAGAPKESVKARLIQRGYSKLAGRL